jgi:hypothetical protein
VSKAIGYRQAIDYLTNEYIEPIDFLAFSKFFRCESFTIETKMKIKSVCMCYCQCSEFSAATRNYAKRQINWFRKDPGFMFVLIRRPEPLTHPNPNLPVTAAATWPGVGDGEDEEGDEDLVPYRVVKDEVVHWCQVPAEEFQGKVRTQVAVNAACGRLKEYWKMPKDAGMWTDAEKMALVYMIHKG